MREITKVISGGRELTKDDLLKWDEVSLRGLLHERAHHNIEVPLYPTLLKGKSAPIAGFGMQAQIVYDAWRERGFPDDDEDIRWVKKYLALAEQVRTGAEPKMDEPISQPFSEEEMRAVRKLFWGRRSGRGCWADKPIPNEMIELILEAGRAAPVGCNLDEVRYIILKPPEENKMMRSDISVENAVVVVICYDTRPSHVTGQDQSVPQNRGYDCAAAGDHMLLMAHALGLSGVWLTKNPQSEKEFKEKYGLSEHIELGLHIAFGWPAMGSVKSARVPLEYMIIQEGKCATNLEFLSYFKSKPRILWYERSYK